MQYEHERQAVRNVYDGCRARSRSLEYETEMGNMLAGEKERGTGMVRRRR